MGGRKTCPRCAERVKCAAQLCRYCGHEFADVPGESAAEPLRDRRVWIAAAALVLIAATIAAVLMVFRDAPADALPDNYAEAASGPADAPPPEPAHEALSVGSTLEWSMAGSGPEVLRQAGPYLVRVSGKKEDDLVAPVVEVSSAGQTVRMEGTAASPDYTHSISVVQNRAGAPPVIMLQSFTGGAHCCTEVRLAGFSGGRLKVLELGMWDGDGIDLPKDLNGDGLADFVVRDDSFLYAFAPYAMSYSPPQVLNVTGGKVIDVSARPAFRKLFQDDLVQAGKECRNASDGISRNGACPAYVASAARTGKLSAAWADMIAAYDASADWELPTGCAVETRDECPPGQEITFKSYPEALLFFLKENGYISKAWLPPEAFESEPQQSQQSFDETA